MQRVLCMRLFLVAACAAVAAAISIFDFTVKGAKNEDYPLAKYDYTPVLMVVNVASECGFTDVNYRGLQTLWEEYHQFGFDIIALPCNQFGAQEPGTYDEIIAFAKTNYKVDFDVFQKVDVNGPTTHPLFKWLKDNTDDGDHHRGGDVAWNFEKFLVVDGQPWRRYAHNIPPSEIEDDILYALAHESEFHHEYDVDVDDHDEL
ncbi:Aste57867_15796 [Aphanomyces stellatus]|uniref:Glutathione peroxidase n=1 Tax=Aphanomyces stellatus TaxID=120398 RepID=A0A485L592_9STRA|nr:hypothetical protein As57867_015740 [Aphanomyces stellatus]VFT92584.1 Aste57867_15796 [Aphanomyces stellatus]